jgi:bifunctional DNase/RNase
MKKFIEVKIDSLRVSLTNQQRIVVLKQANDDRYLPIWIGPYEAESITIALQEIEVSRPQTHDLIKKILDELHVRITRVEVSSLQDDIFYGTLVLEGDSEKYKIDCRPSDAIAVAVRAHVPIMVAEDVMKEASIVPEELNAEVEEEEEESEQGEPSVGGRVPPDEERLSIFEDYLAGKGGEEEGEEGTGEDEEDSDDNEDDEEEK